MEPLTQLLNGPLDESFAALSMGGEIAPLRPARSINPFLEFLSPVQETNQLESLIHDHLLPNLQRRRNLTRLTPNDSFFQNAREIWERKGWTGEGLSNYETLLCGILDFPVILLLNPSGWDHLPWDEMVQSSPTLTWLQRMLEPLGLTLREIIIIDAFSLLTDQKMDIMGNAEKMQLSHEVFNLTIEFLRRFKPRVMISCQCATKTSHPRWGIVNHPLAASLYSSVSEARRQRVSHMALDEHTIHVVRGFHPMHIERQEDPRIRADLDQVLRRTLEALYRPCADWRDQSRRKYEENIATAAEEVNVTMRALFQAISAHRRYQRRATEFGTDPARLGRYYDISDFRNFKRDVQSFVSTMILGSL